MDKLMLSPEEVAQALGVGRSKVYDLMRSDDLPSVKLGRTRRIRVADLETFIAGLTPDGK